MELQDLENDWPAISALLDEALALPPAARGAWLDARTDVEPARRSAVERILSRQAAIESDDFLGALPPLMDGLPPTSGAADEAGVGALVGPYRISAPLGQGGMSTVWRARRDDGRPARDIALKLPLWTWGGRFAERMARERDILATLEHAHIARLYDAGLDAAGRPWLAMELVEGQPIDAACEQAGAHGGRSPGTAAAGVRGRRARPCAPGGTPRPQAAQHRRHAPGPSEAAGLRHRAAARTAPTGPGRR